MYVSVNVDSSEEPGQSSRGETVMMNNQAGKINLMCKPELL